MDSEWILDGLYMDYIMDSHSIPMILIHMKDMISWMNIRGMAAGHP